ncbi:unannotated protein [freshwater metagenome]|uniref:Unannotated protein n=1 Tax=freshwater metagenome TaxID=449393 RepID=A0A6J6GVL9_9ZZZZ
MPCRNTTAPAVPAPCIDSNVSSLTANTASFQRNVTRFAARVRLPKVPHALCSVVTTFGRRPRIDRTAARATEAGSGEWTCTTSHSPSRISFPRRQGHSQSVCFRLRQDVRTPAPSSRPTRWSFHGST